MKYVLNKDNRSTFRLKRMCQAFAVSKSGYYAWQKRTKNKSKHANELLLVKIDDIFHSHHQHYGSRRVWFELRLRGIFCSKNRVSRLMSQADLKLIRINKFWARINSKHQFPIAPNLINKNFVVKQPDHVWISDITYLWTWEGWMYLAVIIDLNSRQVVGWTMSTRINKELVLSAISQAVGRRKPNPGLIFHSERDSQYASYEVRKLHQQHQMIESISNKGDCCDNVVSESFYTTLKLALVYPDFFETHNQMCVQK